MPGTTVTGAAGSGANSDSAQPSWALHDDTMRRRMSVECYRVRKPAAAGAELSGAAAPTLAAVAPRDVLQRRQDRENKAWLTNGSHKAQG